MSNVPLSAPTVSANSIDAAHKRGLPLIRVIFLFMGASSWLILASHALDLSLLETTNWIPVLAIALASSTVTLSLKVYQDSAILPRILPAALAIPLLSIAVGYQNGYLPATFAPLV